MIKEKKEIKIIKEYFCDKCKSGLIVDFLGEYIHLNDWFLSKDSHICENCQ